MSNEPERKGWRTTASRPVYENRWISVTEFDAIAPTGAETIYGVVRMKNFAIGILPVDANGCTLLVGQARFPTRCYSWELPEGGGPRDQEPLVSAKRELSEEAGLGARSWTPLLSGVQLSNSICDEFAYAYIATDLYADTSQPRDASEDLAVRSVPFGEAVRMAVDGEIVDAFSLVMLLKADHLARSGKLPGDLSRLLAG